MKQCCACAEIKDHSLFSRNRAAKDGYQSRCKECQRDYQRGWIDRNRERVNAYNLNRYYTEPPRSRAKRDQARQSWADSNHDKRRVSNAQWAARNKEALRIKEGRRRARLKGAGVFTILPRELDRLLSSPCVACGSSNDIHVDHVIPIARGGRHSIGNLQALCAPCNYKKHSRFFAEFRYRNTTRKAA